MNDFDDKSNLRNIQDSQDDLIRRNRFLEKQIFDLQGILEKITSSNSWKLTAPIRRLGRLKRALTPLFRTRVQDLEVAHLEHITKVADKFAIVGTTPNIILEPKSKRPVSYLVSLEYDFDGSCDHLSFAFYYDLGKGFSGENRKFITLFKDQKESEIINLRAQAFRFRLDPFEQEGSFVLKNLRIRELGKIQVIARFIKKQLRFLSFNPARIFRLVKKIIAILREGGFTALKVKLFAEQFSNDYTQWVLKYDTLSDLDKTQILKSVENLPYRPLISILMPTYNTPEQWLRKAIESVTSQIYPNWELCIADDCSKDLHVKNILNEYAAKDSRIKFVIREKNGHIGAASNSALELAFGEYVGLLDHDDELAPHALYMMVDAINKNRSVGLLYSDEDKLTTYGLRFNPYFKSDWNPELLLSQNYICHFIVIKSLLLKEIKGFREGVDGSQDWDLIFRVTEKLKDQEIVHIPHILYHWRVIPESVAHGTAAKPYAVLAAKKVVEDHLERVAEKGEVSIVESLSNLRVKFSLPINPPLVSLIVLTKDKVTLLKKCISSIVTKTNYPSFEIIVVDNGSKEEATFQYFAEISKDSRIKILKIDEPFNFSRLNNLASKEAKGEVFGFLNNDLEVINKDWLTEMVSFALRKGVGAVGAKLWYPNNLLQHGGVILGIGGVAGHSHKGIERGNPGYFNRAVLTQNLSAVTAACMIIQKSIFENISGFNEKELSVAFNDIDFCLRLKDAGFRNVYAPYAELFHYESASRGYENTPQKFSRFECEVEYMQNRWKNILKNDPYYNPNLTLFNEDFSFAFPPRVTKPWRETENSNVIKIAV